MNQRSGVDCEIQKQFWPCWLCWPLGFMPVRVADCLLLDAIDGPSNDAPHDGDSIDPEDGVARIRIQLRGRMAPFVLPVRRNVTGASIKVQCHRLSMGGYYLREGTICTKEGCVSTICTPNTVECNDAGQRVVCNIDGTAYSTPTDCDEGYACVSGQCLPMICTQVLPRVLPQVSCLARRTTTMG